MGRFGSVVRSNVRLMAGMLGSQGGPPGTITASRDEAVDADIP